MDAKGFLKSWVYPCVCYREDFVLLFCVDDFIMFSTFNDKIDDLYDSLYADLNIENDG